LDATLASGQAFRWRRADGAWEGVIGGRWARLRIENAELVAQTVGPEADWRWLEHYLQLRVDVGRILETFPQDGVMPDIVKQCRGLRLLRQDPWECLASFICSSTKQIVQIEQVVGNLCGRFGAPVAAPQGRPAAWAFPAPQAIAAASEGELRECKMGFRAPYLRAAAQAVASGRLDLERLCGLPLDQAQAELEQLPGVGPKIAHCVLLFGYGFAPAFPMDVWILRGLKELYFPRRKAGLAELRRFAQSHFGPHAGYAQQYLFHAMRSGKLTPRQKNPPPLPS